MTALTRYQNKFSILSGMFNLALAPAWSPTHLGVFTCISNNASAKYGSLIIVHAEYCLPVVHLSQHLSV